MVCLLPLGVPPPCLGSPSTWLSLSLYVDRGVARHAWLAAPVHGFLEGPRMGPCSFPLYLGFLLTTCGTSIGGYGKYVLSLVSPRCPACSCSPCALISLRSCVRLCGHCVAEFWTAAVLLRSGLHARLAGSLATVLGPSRGLLVYSVTQWLGVQVTPGPDFMGCFLVPQDFFFWQFWACCLRLIHWGSSHQGGLVPAGLHYCDVLWSR
ncbi:hypothetical protein V6N12_028994 [Hibiscus sabdariffa]|uniref:Uncharacterized protein n=1 Tax=Hibiscus sabdariffa TaxID=183260 RepID=A0ABR2F7I0_9ROSI